MPATRSKTKTNVKPKSKPKPKAKAKANSRTKVKAKTNKRSSMPMLKVKNKAKKLGVTPGKMNKYDLIHAIQQAEHYNPCYGTSNGQCGNSNCCFMTDCLKVTA